MVTKLAARLEPKGAFPAVRDSDVEGGLRTISTFSAFGSEVPLHTRKAGAWVVTEDDGREWMITPDLSRLQEPRIAQTKADRSHLALSLPDDPVGRIVYPGTEAEIFTTDDGETFDLANWGMQSVVDSTIANTPTTGYPRTVQTLSYPEEYSEIVLSKSVQLIAVKEDGATSLPDWEYKKTIPQVIENTPDTGYNRISQVLSQPDEDEKILFKWLVGNHTVMTIADDGTVDLPTYTPPSAAGLSDDLAYITAGTLTLVGGDAILGNANLTVLSAQQVGGVWRVVYDFDDGVMGGRVSASGDLFPDGFMEMLLGYGQSNGPGYRSAADLSAQTNPAPTRILMPDTPSGTVRMGIDAVSGATEDPVLDPDDITGFIPLASVVSDTDFGRTCLESFAMRMGERALAVSPGWSPLVCGFNTAEGGERISRLRKTDSPATEGLGISNAYANTMAALTKLTALAQTEYGLPSRLRYMPFLQGESNTGDTDLGEQQEALRAEMEADIQAVTGQSEGLTMLAMQMCSAQSSHAHLRSQLDQHITSAAGNGRYIMVGPTYPYDFYSDFLHHSDAGQRAIGEMMDIAAAQHRRGEGWDPLYVLSAVKQSSTEILVTFNAPIAIDTTNVAAFADNGVVVAASGTPLAIAGMEVDGAELLVTTSVDNTPATNLRLVNNLQSGTRTEANIPRCNIRSAELLGTGYGDFEHYRWACHQYITYS